MHLNILLNLFLWRTLPNRASNSLPSTQPLNGPLEAKSDLAHPQLTTSQWIIILLREKAMLLAKPCKPPH